VAGVTLYTRFDNTDAGWTYVDPNDFEDIIYVSDSDGHDSNNGRSYVPNPTNIGGAGAAGPYKTLSKGVSVLNTLTNGHCYALLFRCTDLFYRQQIGQIKVSGYYDGTSDPKQDPAHVHPLVIGCYDPNAADPRVPNPGTAEPPTVDLPSGGYGVYTSGASNGGSGGRIMAVLGLNIKCSLRDPTDTVNFDSTVEARGNILLNPHDWVLFEDVSVRDVIGAFGAANDGLNTSSPFYWNPRCGPRYLHRCRTTNIWYRQGKSSAVNGSQIKMFFEENMLDEALWNELLQSYNDCTITNANPAVITWGGTFGWPFVDNDLVYFKAGTGTLPASIVAGTAYYVKNASKAGGTFEVSTTPGGASVDTSLDSGSGTVQVAWAVLATQNGANQIYSHNIYLADYWQSTGDTEAQMAEWHGNLSSRGAGGDQLRSTINCTYNLYAYNPLPHNTPRSRTDVKSDIFRNVYINATHGITLPTPGGYEWGPLAVYGYNLLGAKIHECLISSCAFPISINAGATGIEFTDNALHNLTTTAIDLNNGAIIGFAVDNGGSGGTGAIASFDPYTFNEGTPVSGGGTITHFNAADIICPNSDGTDNTYSNVTMSQYGNNPNTSWGDAGDYVTVESAGTTVTATITVSGGVVTNVEFLAGDDGGTGWHTGFYLTCNVAGMPSNWRVKVPLRGTYTIDLVGGSGTGAQLEVDVDMDGKIHHGFYSNQQVRYVGATYKNDTTVFGGVRIPGSYHNASGRDFSGTTGTGFATGDVLTCDPTDPNYGTNVPADFTFIVGPYILDSTVSTALGEPSGYAMGIQLSNVSASGSGTVTAEISFSGGSVSGAVAYMSDHSFQCGVDYLKGDTLQLTRTCYGISGATLSVATPSLNMQTNNQVDPGSEPGRTVESYNQFVLGGSGDTTNDLGFTTVGYRDFLDKVFANSRWNWDKYKTAKAAVDYLLVGAGIVGQQGTLNMRQLRH